jgi:hypothetical protein
VGGTFEQDEVLAQEGVGLVGVGGCSTSPNSAWFFFRGGDRGNIDAVNVKRQ